MTTVEDTFLAIFLDEAKDILDIWERSTLAFGEHSTRDEVDALFRAAHNLKGSSRSVGLQAFGSFVHKIEDLMTDVGQDRVPKSDKIRNVLMDSHEIMSQWIDRLKVDSGYEADTHALILRIEDLRGNKDSAANEMAAFGLFDEQPPASNESRPQISSPSTAQAGAQSSATAGIQSDRKAQGEAEESIRIPSKKVDTIFRDLSELSIQMSVLEHVLQSEHSNSAPLKEAIEKASKIVRNAQEEVLSLRMLPLRGLFQRLERTVLDISRKIEKKVEIKTHGGETELDKYVIEQIKDPLIHIIRNAIDHGIERGEQRVAGGKNEQGTVTISALQRSGSVEITITDDGRGLDEEKILKKAREKGLISGDEKLTPQAIKNLIFLPGFSTAEQVSDISGRGVGMDVVKTAIATLRGTIGISSVTGHGTTFTITLPATLSLFDVLIIESEGRQFAVPISDIVEIIELNAATISARDAKGQSIIYQNQMMPLVSLHTKLGLSTEQDSQGDSSPLALIGQSENGMAAVTVNRILGQKTVVTRPMAGGLKRLSHFSGMTLLGNGEPCLILDMRNLTDGILLSLQKSETNHVA